MIIIWTTNPDYSNEKTTTFEDVNKALRFLYKMYNLGYRIIGWKCDDSWEHEYLERRFRK